MAGDRLMRSALSLADRGMSVFPLRPGTKRPAVQRDWEGCATTDVEKIERWWHRAPYNIGVATGPSRLVVVDLDAPHDGGQHGRQVLADLARKADAEIPRETFTVVTPGGGWHLYFRAPDEVTLTNTAGRLGPRIDTRAVGGYVVAPGSRVDRHSYRIVNYAEPAPLPAWLITELRPVVPLPRPAPAVAHSRYVDAALRDEARRVAEAVPGQRNTVLFQAAAKLARFVQGGQLDAATVIAPLTSAAMGHVGEEGFTVHEIDRAIRSGLRHGAVVQPVSGSRPGPPANRHS